MILVCNQYRTSFWDFFYFLSLLSFLPPSSFLWLYYFENSFRFIAKLKGRYRMPIYLLFPWKMASLGKCLFRSSAPNGIVCFSPYRAAWVLHTSDIILLSDTRFANILSHSVSRFSFYGWGILTGKMIQAKLNIVCFFSWPWLFISLSWWI